MYSIPVTFNLPILEVHCELTNIQRNLDLPSPRKYEKYHTTTPVVLIQSSHTHVPTAITFPFPIPVHNSQTPLAAGQLGFKLQTQLMLVKKSVQVLRYDLGSSSSSTLAARFVVMHS